jgi:hypothetical protein
MKRQILTLILTLAGFSAGCGQHSHELAEIAHEHFVAPLHKDGEGISLSAATRESISLQTTEVTARTEGAQQVLTVPKAAVLNTTAGSSVYVENGEYYKRTVVELGRTLGDSVEIKEGVYEGDIVVTNAAQTLWLIELRAVKGGKGCCPMPDAKDGREDIGHGH